jgi:hypothetical protein
MEYLDLPITHEIVDWEMIRFRDFLDNIPEEVVAQHPRGAVIRQVRGLMDKQFYLDRVQQSN